MNPEVQKHRKIQKAWKLKLRWSTGLRVKHEPKGRFRVIHGQGTN